MIGYRLLYSEAFEDIDLLDKHSTLLGLPVLCAVKFQPSTQGVVGMSKDKEFSKSLKAPDSFQQTMAGLVNWVAANQALFFGSIGVLLLVFAGVFGWQFFRDKKITARQEALAEIDYQYAKEEEEVAKKRADLTKEMTDAKKPASGSDKNTAKQDQLQRTIDGLKADHTASMEKYKAYYESNKDVNEGWLAGMRYAGYLLSQKKFADARPIYEHILEKSKNSDFHQMHVGFVYANQLVEEKDFEKALQQTDMLLAKATDDIKPQVYLLRARILLAKGDKESATKALDALIKDHASSTEAQKAKSMKAVLL